MGWRTDYLRVEAELSKVMPDRSYAEALVYWVLRVPL